MQLAIRCQHGELLFLGPGQMIVPYSDKVVVYHIRGMDPELDCDMDIRRCSSPEEAQALADDIAEWWDRQQRNAVMIPDFDPRNLHPTFDVREWHWRGDRS